MWIKHPKKKKKKPVYIFLEELRETGQGWKVQVGHRDPVHFL